MPVRVFREAGSTVTISESTDTVVVHADELDALILDLTREREFFRPAPVTDPGPDQSQFDLEGA